MCAIAFDCASHRSNKRKHEDYALGPQSQSQRHLLRMRKSHAYSSPFSSSSLSSSSSSSSSFAGRIEGSYGASCVGRDQEPTFFPGMVQFFVRMFRKTLVVRASPDDTVEDLHDRIEKSEGIPKGEQRFVFCGRQLQWEKTLGDSGVENDSCIHLTARMRSTEYSKSWIVCDDIISATTSLRHGRPHLLCGGGDDIQGVEALVKLFLSMANKIDAEHAWGHLQVFMLSGASTALVMLYAWKSSDGLADEKHNSSAKSSIQLFINSKLHKLGTVHDHCAPIILEFCRLLAKAVGTGDVLYKSCRRAFANTLERSVNDPRLFNQPRSINAVKELTSFLEQLGLTMLELLSHSMAAKLFPDTINPLSDVLSEFSKFLVALRKLMEDQLEFPLPILLSLSSMRRRTSLSERCLALMYSIFEHLLGKVNQCFGVMEELMLKDPGVPSENQCSSWSFFLVLLTELNVLSNIFVPAQEKLHAVLLARRVPLSTLVGQVKRNDSFLWILSHKDVINFEARRNLVMMLFPDERDDYDEQHEMLIDRSQLLAESFEYIAQAEPYNLKAGIFMQFKNEEATGPGVIREWFCSLCQELFSPNHVLFQMCPSDRRRFFPNPKSIVDPLHLRYFVFCGRIIALALMHKVQVGILFDRIFFLQLVGKHISLEDVRDADPILYRSCKQILEMDASILDSDSLGLTFAREIDDMGTFRVVELCDGGEHISVNSKNRQKYVDLLIQHHFVTSISKQISHFSQGFGDILSDSNLQQLFFRSLDLEDFDKILGGSENAICMRDWKAHTEYNGYRKNDRQIKWFWKVVEDMSMEQRRILIIFWTAVRYLPFDGFGGLSSKLYIHRTSESDDHLPTSHTCFYQLCLPKYSSMSIMRARLQLLTQAHISSSFGLW